MKSRLVVRVPNRLARTLDRKIAPLVIAQHQSAASLRAKISYRDRLRSEVKGKNANLPRHDSKVPNPKSQFPRKSQAPNFQTAQIMRFRIYHLNLGLGIGISAR